MPALVTVSNEVGELRYISRSRMMKLLRARVAIPSWSCEDFVSAHDRLQKMEILELSSPPDMRRNCEFIDGMTSEEKADKLAAVFKALQ